MLGRSLGMVCIGLLVACSGATGSDPAPEDPSTGSAKAQPADPEARLRALVEDIVTLAGETECARFGAAITSWTDSHAAEVDQLIGALAKGEDTETLAELDGYVETRRLVVLEAAADCGEFEDAWPAWQHFEAMVDGARR